MAPPPVLLVTARATGGIVSHLRDLIAGLDGRVARYTVLAPPQTLAALRLPPHVAAWAWPAGERVSPADAVRLVAALRRRARGHALVHAHGYRAGVLAALALAGWQGRPGRPALAVTCHNPWPGGVEAWAARLLLRRADAVVAVSRALKGALATRGLRPERILAIPNGVALPALAGGLGGAGPPRAGSPPGAPQGAAGILVAARLARPKGVEVAIDALAYLLATPLPGHRAIELWLAGEGPEEGALRARARERGVEGRVRFLGHRADLPAWMRRAAAVAIPSLGEGLPYVLLEALALGRPVVATAVEGIVEVVEPEEPGEAAAGPPALLVPPGDARALAAALARVLEDPELAARLGAAGRERVAHRYTLEHMLERTAALYGSLMP